MKNHLGFVALVISLAALVLSFIALAAVGAYISVVDFELPQARPLDPDVVVDNYNRSALRLCPECETLKHCNWSDNDTKCLLENLAILGRNDDRIEKIMGR